MKEHEHPYWHNKKGNYPKALPKDHNYHRDDAEMHIQSNLNKLNKENAKRGSSYREVE